MTYASKIDGNWTIVLPGGPVKHEGIVTSWDSLMTWSDAEREEFGVYKIAEPSAPPEGQYEVSRVLGGTDRPMWAIETAPSPPAPVPDGPTLSDWRVALIQMGRFAEVRASIEAVRDSGAVDGLIAWERFEYANHVYRAELLRLAPVMGFTVAEVDESLTRAAQIASASLA